MMDVVYKEEGGGVLFSSESDLEAMPLHRRKVSVERYMNDDAQCSDAE